MRPSPVQERENDGAEPLQAPVGSYTPVKASCDGVSMYWCDWYPGDAVKRIPTAAGREVLCVSLRRVAAWHHVCEPVLRTGCPRVTAGVSHPARGDASPEVICRSLPSACG